MIKKILLIFLYLKNKNMYKKIKLLLYSVHEATGATFVVNA